MKTCLIRMNDEWASLQVFGDPLYLWTCCVESLETQHFTAGCSRGSPLRRHLGAAEVVGEHATSSRSATHVRRTATCAVDQLKTRWATLQPPVFGNRLPVFAGSF